MYNNEQERFVPFGLPGCKIIINLICTQECLMRKYGIIKNIRKSSSVMLGRHR